MFTHGAVDAAGGKNGAHIQLPDTITTAEAWVKKGQQVAKPGLARILWFILMTVNISHTSDGHC